MIKNLIFISLVSVGFGFPVEEAGKSSNAQIDETALRKSIFDGVKSNNTVSKCQAGRDGSSYGGRGGSSYGGRDGSNNRDGGKFMLDGKRNLNFNLFLKF